MENLIMEYILDQALIVIPALLILGMFFKSTPKFADWLIPYVLLGLGVVATIGLMGVSVDAVIQGVLVSGAAVFGHELYKQGKERD